MDTLYPHALWMLKVHSVSFFQTRALWWILTCLCVFSSSLGIWGKASPGREQRMVRKAPSQARAMRFHQDRVDSLCQADPIWSTWTMDTLVIFMENAPQNWSLSIDTKLGWLCLLECTYNWFISVLPSFQVNIFSWCFSLNEELLSVFVLE